MKRVWKKSDVPRTGWPAVMLQDDSRELSRWFASRLGARHVVDIVCREIRVNTYIKDKSS